MYVYTQYKLNSKTVAVSPSLDPALISPFHLLPSPVHSTGVFFYIFPGFLVICILLSSNNISTYIPRSFSFINMTICNYIFCQLLFINLLKLVYKDSYFQHSSFDFNEFHLLLTFLSKKMSPIFFLLGFFFIRII